MLKKDPWILKHYFYNFFSNFRHFFILPHSLIHVRSFSAKQISTQKFESPGFQIEHKINWKVDSSFRGIQ